MKYNAKKDSLLIIILPNASQEENLRISIRFCEARRLTLQQRRKGERIRHAGRAGPKGGSGEKLLTIPSCSKAANSRPEQPQTEQSPQKKLILPSRDSFPTLAHTK